jgi:NAD-dependent dihydropyrimidine dehydrogenase PreA subunit
VEVHAERCKGCGRCVAACPQGVLAISTHSNRAGYFVAEAVALERCSRCGLCFYNCPEPGGITVRRKSQG